MSAMPPPALQSNQFRVVVPQGVYPNQQFDVSAPDGQRLRLVCPPNVYAGQTFIAQLPPPAPVQNNIAPAASASVKYASDSRVPTTGPDGTLMVAGFTSSAPPQEVEAQMYDPSAFDDSVAPIEVAALPVSAGVGAPAAPPSGGAQFRVVIPPGVRPGQSFEVNAGGTRMMVQCPFSAAPGSTITIQAPAGAAPSSPASAPPAVAPAPARAPQQQPQQQAPAASGGPPSGQMDITVPAGVEPGESMREACRVSFAVTYYVSLCY